VAQSVVALWYKPDSTQPLKEKSSRNISLGGGGKGGRCVRLTSLPPSCADCLEIWEPQPPGTQQEIYVQLNSVLLLRNLYAGCARWSYYSLLLTKFRIHVAIYRVIRNDCRGFNNLPPRSPDVPPCDFFLWGYVKDQVYVPPLPTSFPKLKELIRTSIETTTADMLQTVWNELDYRVDVCRITKGAHIEHL